MLLDFVSIFFGSIFATLHFAGDICDSTLVASQRQAVPGIKTRQLACGLASPLEAAADVARRN